ncbi:hypothetical protein VNO78_07848 [Psophocarpus tetragonolobus]|uniref:Uncharacterized protein n=1 Tax=Psophocarpus tetragonolobus TaxID=3891 RepID=A0AAN9STZ6_PSOTE
MAFWNVLPASLLVWGGGGNLRSQVDDLAVKLKQANSEILYQYVAGFDGVVEQVKYLIPKLDLMSVRLFNDVVDGKIVDIAKEGANA